MPCQGSPLSLLARFSSVLLLLFVLQPQLRAADPFSKPAKGNKSNPVIRKTVELTRALQMRVEPTAHLCDHIDTIACTEEATVVPGALTTADCRLEDGSYVDFYQFEGTAGEVVTIEMTSSDFDTFLVLLDPNLAVVAVDDDSAGGTNSRITFALDISGTWLIAANSFDGDEFGAYLLSLRGCGVPACEPIPESITCSVTRTGALADPDCTLPDGSFYDVFEFTGIAGTRVTIRMRSAVIDSYLFLLDPSGQVVAQDDDSAGGTDAEMTFTLNATGTWVIIANSFDEGETGNYTVTLLCEERSGRVRAIRR
ncbi:MAG TPA: PPC domain-containing protein [Thermoanaerobaculia bacterium]|nr:PPC domain-containing protein [Thermoanaerobaculia bacterium]